MPAAMGSKQSIQGGGIARGLELIGASEKAALAFGHQLGNR